MPQREKTFREIASGQNPDRPHTHFIAQADRIAIRPLRMQVMHRALSDISSYVSSRQDLMKGLDGAVVCFFAIYHGHDAMRITTRRVAANT